MTHWLIVMLGGAAGTLARHLASTALASRVTSHFPWGTFVVNITGCFLIGVLMPLLPVRSHWRLLLVTGFLGGYTTFSSFEYEAFASARGGRPWHGLLYVVASVVAGYIAVWLGSATTTRR